MIDKKQKIFSCRNNIGKSKYTVSYHDGIKKHSDGSPFFDIAIFSNAAKRDGFTANLRSNNYREI